MVFLRKELQFPFESKKKKESSEEKKEKRKKEERTKKKRRRKRKKRKKDENLYFFDSRLIFFPFLVSGVVNVGIQTTLTDSELSHLIELTQLKVLICSKNTLPKIAKYFSGKSSSASSSSCKFVILFDEDEEEQVAVEATPLVSSSSHEFPDWVTVRSMSQIEHLGSEMLSKKEPFGEKEEEEEKEKSSARNENLFTLIFTSGSTGLPKV